MSSVAIRTFAAADWRPVVSLWNRCLSKDPITEERFWQLFLLDVNFDAAGAQVAEIDGEVVGFLHAIRRRLPLGSLGLQTETGWITAFFVAPEFRRQGTGSRLLEAGLAFLKVHNRTQVLCNGYSPYYVFPGVDADYTEARAFLEAKGFRKVSDPVAMGMRLEGVRMPEAVRAKQALLQTEGYSVRQFRREDTLSLLNFAEEFFPHWQPSLADGLQHGNLEITAALRNGEVVGFAQWENPYNDPPAGSQGRFGPFGIRDDLRNRGIGAVLFYSLVEHVAGNGARYLWFGWAGGRNLSFYERAGCKVTRQFRLYKLAI